MIPTWASTNSILFQIQENGKKNKKINNSAATLLIRLPSTDNDALCTIMCMAEETELLVQGKVSQVIMTMSMHL